MNKSQAGIIAGPATGTEAPLTLATGRQPCDMPAALRHADGAVVGADSSAIRAERGARGYREHPSPMNRLLQKALVVAEELDLAQVQAIRITGYETHAVPGIGSRRANSERPRFPRPRPALTLGLSAVL